MDKALSYLLFRKWKNGLVAALKKPGTWFFILIFAMVFVTSFLGKNSWTSGEDLRNRGELVALVFAFLALIVFSMLLSGLKRGAALFSMADVNYVFVSPIPSHKVLFYGMIQTIPQYLITGIFILFQYVNVQRFYDVNIGGLFLLYLCYNGVIFAVQPLIMFLFTRTHDDEKKQSMFRILFFVFAGVFLLYGGWTASRHPEGLLQGAISLTNSSAMYAVPFAGWGAIIAGGILQGEIYKVLIGTGLCILCIAIFSKAIVNSKEDYYEEVLQGAEATQSAITSQREGKVAELSPEKVNKGRIGLLKGEGASAFYHKHLIENRRGGKFFINGVQIFIVIATLIVVKFFLKENWIMLLSLSCYGSFFGVTADRFSRELSRPYIYMVPASSFSKILWAMLESLQRYAVESVLIFVIAMFIMAGKPVEVAAFIVARVAIHALFLTVQLLKIRIFGMEGTGYFSMLMTFFFTALLVLPGILAMAGALGLGFSLAAVLMIMTAVDLILAALVAFLCRNILKTAQR